MSLCLTGLGGFTGYLIRYIITRADRLSDQHDAMQRDVLLPVIQSNKDVAAGLREVAAGQREITDVMRRIFPEEAPPRERGRRPAGRTTEDYTRE